VALLGLFFGEAAMEIAKLAATATMSSGDVVDSLAAKPYETPDIFKELKELGNNHVLTPRQADAFANRMANILLSTAASTARANPEHLSKKEVRAIVDHFYAVRSFCVTFKASIVEYQSAHSIINDALYVTSFAEATIVPAILLGSNSGSRSENIKTYIVLNSVSGLIKIGKSINPSDRMKSLQTGSGVALDVLAILDGDKERDLHKKFAGLRVFGEWFSDPDGLICEYAKTACVAGTGGAE
jgi:hypothetical protein